MRAAGVDRIGGGIRLLELPDPPPPRAGEVVLEVRACGVGNGRRGKLPCIFV
jgi:D-arabinose 1-dehydrogenase-like Zn-dependent alcohol dehydrogenase